MDVLVRSRPLALSLAVYAIPIVSAHSLGLLGPTLVAELRSDRPASWIAADMSLAVGAQAVLAAATWVALGWGPLAGVIALMLATVATVYAMNLAYMVARSAGRCLDVLPVPLLRTTPGGWRGRWVQRSVR